MFYSVKHSSLFLQYRSCIYYYEKGFVTSTMVIKDNLAYVQHQLTTVG